MSARGGARPGAGRKAGPTATDAQRFIAARADKEAALARLRQAEADERERRLIPVAEVEAAVAVAHATVANALLSLPDELERSVGLTPEQAEHAERVIHAAMDGLADAMATLGLPNP
jgi:molecular chaperone GrpE (heat shock protein)